MTIKKLTFLLLLAITVTAYGQEENSDQKLTIDVGADLVSSYVWRGWHLAGPSIQPALSLSAYGITIGAWGSKDFSTIDKEIDLSLSYEIKGFTIGVSDYWMMYEEAPYFKNRGSHLIEGSLGFTFSPKFPLSIEVNTFLFGDEDECEKGQKYYSTYISGSFPFSVGDVMMESKVGVTPWRGMYSDKFGVAAISLRATKELQISAKYALPVYTELTVAPVQNNIFLVFGITF